MSQNLKARLKLINKTRGTEKKSQSAVKKEVVFDKNLWLDWEEVAPDVLKKDIELKLPPFNKVFPNTLSILIPDFLEAFLDKKGRLPLIEKILFFDLETTGLSGGAGTIAFLAAFGRFTEQGSLKITQYLLLDYPGECDFIEAVVNEIKHPVLVTYNGKSFDTQILLNRCLMNRIKAPSYYHGDLLHPARRLWKNILPSCSQAVIETSILDLDRTDDVSGAMAPEIWFSFLRSKDNTELLKICTHNEKDIFGLATMFITMTKIADNPYTNKISYDEEALALYWESTIRKNPLLFSPEEKSIGEKLLIDAANKGGKKASYRLSFIYFRNGMDTEARKLLQSIKNDFRALKALAIDAEWRLCDIKLTLKYVNKALSLSEISEKEKEDMEKRQMRLEGKKEG